MSKTIVIGAGSIGKRHLRNLKQLGRKDLWVVDPDATNQKIISDELNIKNACADFNEIEIKPGDVVFVATPNHLHASQALLAVQKEAHVFVEKPLAHNWDGVQRLCQIAQEKNLVTMVGCNMRFYPAIRLIKKYLTEQRIGKVLSYRVEVGIYLPNWRPHLDYRKNYGAHKSQGGGALLDMIHEIDYSRWLFGDPQGIYAAYDKVSGLEIDTEDIAEMILFHNGMIGNIHLNYLSQKYTRKIHVIGETGNLLWDWHANGVFYYDKDTKQDTFSPIPEGYNLNEMYLAETQHFLDCVQGRTQTCFPFAEAKRVLDITLAAKISSEEKQYIDLSKAHI